MVDDNGRLNKDEAALSGHESNEIESSVSDIYKFPRPIKRTRIKNDTRSIKNRSKAQERGLAGRYRESGFKDSKRIPGSGSWGTVIADVDPGEWLLAEAKQTKSGKLVIEPEWVKKIAYQAKQMGRPWWALHGWSGEASGPYSKVVILDEDHFFQLMKLLKNG